MPFRLFSRKTMVSIVCGGLLLIGAGWAFGDLVLQAAGDFLVVSGRPVPVGLIVVLGGDFLGPRVRMGAALAEAGYARKVLISGPLYRRGSTFLPEAEIAIETLVRQGHRPQLFEAFLIHGRSTIDEIGELGVELRRRGVREILLVTSDYHSRRACVAFSLEATGIRANCIAAPDPVFRCERWWENSAQRLRVRSEWTKLVGTILLRLPHFLFTRPAA